MNSSMASFWISLATSLPLYLIWIIGTIAAIVLWSRHPGVSAVIVGALCTMLMVSLGQRICTFAIIEGAQRAGRSVTSMGVLLAVVGTISSLLRTGAFAAVLVALFGWRDARPMPPLETVAQRVPFQFSILTLMLLTLAVAVVCALIRALIGILGESAVFLVQLIDDLPWLVCLLIGFGLAIGRRSRHPQVSLLAVIGMGLILTVSVAWQIVWMMVASRGSGRMELISAGGMVLSSMAWVLVLIAVFGWRGTSASPPHGASGETYQPRSSP